MRDRSTLEVDQSSFPDDDEWIDDAYDELPDNSWLALAKAFPAQPLCLACVVQAGQCRGRCPAPGRPLPAH